MKSLSSCLALVGLLAVPAVSLRSDNHVLRLLESHRAENTITALSSPSYPVYNISTPLDHFHNDCLYEPHSDDDFPMRYWFDDTHYVPGGPVIVIAAGETEGENRLPFIKHGIGAILAEATGGLAVVLEHRYYGDSLPSPKPKTTQDFRFLTTDQALADTAYFAKNVQFPGLEAHNLTAPGTPWIIYGGSYAGAFAALARKLYADVFWGGISSSGVPAAVIDYWEYLEAAREFAPGDCSPVTQKLTHIVDNILSTGDSDKIDHLMSLFGLKGLSHADFGETIAAGIHGLQGTNWDPEEDSSEFGKYCAVVSSTSLLFQSTAHLQSTVKDIVALGGYAAESETLTVQMLNYIGYVKDYVGKALSSKDCKGLDVVECFSQDAGYRRANKDDWLTIWQYQVCTQWGYFRTGSGCPEDKLPLVSRAITLDYKFQVCPVLFNITTMPNVTSINRWGEFDFSYPRLAFIDGAQDPWRDAGVHKRGLDRESSVSEPYYLVDWGVHHWEENGLRDERDRTDEFPPKQIVDAQRFEVEFVKAWVKEFKEEKAKKQTESSWDEPGEL